MLSRLNADDRRVFSAIYLRTIYCPGRRRNHGKKHDAELLSAAILPKSLVLKLNCRGRFCN